MLRKTRFGNIHKSRFWLNRAIMQRKTPKSSKERIRQASRPAQFLAPPPPDLLPFRLLSEKQWEIQRTSLESASRHPPTLLASSVLEIPMPPYINISTYQSACQYINISIHQYITIYVNIYISIYIYINI